jgi:hypothetical protein
VWVAVADVVVPVVLDIVPVADVSVAIVSVPVVIIVSVAIVSVAIVSDAIVSDVVIVVSVAAESVVASSFLQPTASIETTKRATRVITRDFFMRNSPSVSGLRPEGCCSDGGATDGYGCLGARLTSLCVTLMKSSRASRE